MQVSLNSHGFFETCNLYITLRHIHFNLGYASPSATEFDKDKVTNDANIDCSGR